MRDGREPGGPRPSRSRRGAVDATPRGRLAYCTTGLGSSFAAQSPELKSVKRMRPFHGIAFMTNGALGV